MLYLCFMQGYIYIIRNSINDKFYIGSTKNYHVRKLKHFNELRKNKHHSIHLQRAFNKYSEKHFEFIIIETCYNYLKREQYLFDNVIDFKNTYNVSKMATGGDLIYNHPNKANIIKKATENLKKALRPKPRFGNENSNWKGGKTFCKCGTRINSNTKTCIKCQDKTGKNNSFYGKNHSEKFKSERSVAMKGVYKGKQEKPVLIDNVEYKSVSYAAKQLKVCAATIIHRIKSKNVKFKYYFYKEKL